MLRYAILYLDRMYPQIRYSRYPRMRVAIPASTVDHRTDSVTFGYMWCSIFMWSRYSSRDIPPRNATA